LLRRRSFKLPFLPLLPIPPAVFHDFFTTLLQRALSQLIVAGDQAAGKSW